MCQQTDPEALLNGVLANLEMFIVQSWRAYFSAENAVAANEPKSAVEKHYKKKLDQSMENAR